MPKTINTTINRYVDDTLKIFFKFFHKTCPAIKYHKKIYIHLREGERISNISNVLTDFLLLACLFTTSMASDFERLFFLIS